MKHLELELSGLLPVEALVGEVAVLGRLPVDWLREVEVADDDTGPHVEVGADDLDKLVRGLVRGAVCLNEKGKRLGNTDGVRKLHERAAGELCMDEGLCDPASEVCSGTVDLAVVLSGESTTSVGSPSTVGIHDDLTASQTGVTLWATDDEEARRLDL